MRERSDGTCRHTCIQEAKEIKTPQAFPDREGEKAGESGPMEANRREWVKN